MFLKSLKNSICILCGKKKVCTNFFFVERKKLCIYNGYCAEAKWPKTRIYIQHNKHRIWPPTPVFLLWEIPWTEDIGAWQATVHWVPRVGDDLASKPPPLPGKNESYLFPKMFFRWKCHTHTHTHTHNNNVFQGYMHIFVCQVSQRV